MGKILAINPLHVNYFRPLLKWKILDVQTLYREIEPRVKMNTFRTVMRRWEKRGILKSFKDPYVRRKFVYFSKEAEKYLSLDEVAIPNGIEHAWHDAKVSEVVRKILEMEVFTDVYLETTRLGVDGFCLENEVYPDARLEGSCDEGKFNVAFELELTRKSKTRILEKCSRYLDQDRYDYVMFLFPQKSMMDSYYRFMKERVGGRINNFILFFYSDELVHDEINLQDFKGIFNEKETNFYEFFKRFSNE